jgi:hypothetical protein
MEGPGEILFNLRSKRSLFDFAIIHLLIMFIPIGFKHICNRCTSVVNILLLNLFCNDFRITMNTKSPKLSWKQLGSTFLNTTQNCILVTDYG